LQCGNTTPQLGLPQLSSITGTLNARLLVPEPFDFVDQSAPLRVYLIDCSLSLSGTLLHRLEGAVGFNAACLR
jgi:hypothetical protein